MTGTNASSTDNQKDKTMNIKRNIASITALVAIGMVSVAGADTPTITGVTARQRYPWNGIVDISYEVVGNVTTGLPNGSVPFLWVTATNRTDGTCYEASATALLGDTGTEEGLHHVVWDMSAQGLELESSNLVFTVAYIPLPLYCVIDLSAGANAANYSVSYLQDVPAGGWTDEYKTTKLVLRRIWPGTIPTRDAAITKSFYIGVFEVTQRQYELVMGTNPCSSSSYGKGNSYPVHLVSYSTIRGSSNGAKWPSSSTVEATSFMGKIRKRTGISEFDLPTAAQWEYACRSGTATSFSYGDTEDGDYMWAVDNSGGQSHPVGMKNASAWGLYDIHGNVWEWCLDWAGGSLVGDDPIGASSGSKRVGRGGSWYYRASDCTSSFQYNYSPESVKKDGGFRIVRTQSSSNDELNSAEYVWVKQSGTVLCSEESVLTSVSISSSWQPDSTMSFTDGLVAHYTFDGDANDDSGNGNNGVIHGVTPTNDRHGNVDGAYHFDGTAAYIEVLDSDSLRQVGQTVTLSAWVKIDGWYSGWASILCKGASGGQPRVQINNNGRWQFDSQANEILASQSPHLNSWCHVAVTYTPTQLSAYLNGELIGTKVPAASLVGKQEPLYIGIDPNGNVEYLKGDMDEVRVYNRALSAAEVRALSNGNNPIAALIGEGTHVYNYDVGDSIGIVQAGIGTVDSTLNIPSAIDNKPVVSIGCYAFTDCGDLETVTIPASVTEIGDYAFAGCSNLAQVTLSSDVSTLTVGGNAFDMATAVTVEPKEGLYFGGWTNETGVIISDPFHSSTSMTVSPRWMNDGEEYAEHLIFFEDFERDTMEFELTTVGTFQHSASIQDGKGVDGSKGFGFGRSSATGGAHLNYVNTLTASFCARYFITRVEFDEMERYGNWGSCGSIIINRIGDEQVEKNDFCKVPENDKVADKEYRHRSIEIGMMATNISFQVSDITDVSEEFMDNVKIYGRLARQYAVAFDANGGVGEMTAQTVIEGDALVLASNIFVRAGYMFQGWSAKADGNAIYADGVTIPDVPANLEGTRFYAVWKPCAPNVVPADDATFTYASATVSFSHDANDVTIFYTTDGNNPAVNGREYKGEFAVYKSCTIRAVAYGAGQYSDEVSVMLTRSDNLGEAANLYGYLLETDENNPWTVDSTVSHDGSSSVKSGAIGNNGNTYLAAAVRKAGTVSFWWRAQCEALEEEDGETYWYDYGSFFVDDVVKARIAGHETGWQFVSVDVPNGGKHVLRWEYRKDGATTYQPDCIWLDQVQWVPADGSGCTFTSPEPVPYSWLRQYNLGVLEGDFEAAANAASSKMNWGRPTCVWEEYVAGVDPTNAASIFMAKIEMKDGTPVVTWEPNLNTNGIVRIYKVYGSETLENGGDWQYPTNSLHKFFKVTVEMP